jgi:hypothetical protein
MLRLEQIRKYDQAEIRELLVRMLQTVEGKKEIVSLSEDDESTQSALGMMIQEVCTNLQCPSSTKSGSFP